MMCAAGSYDRIPSTRRNDIGGKAIALEICNINMGTA
jgi:hypothetical protein